MPNLSSSLTYSFLTSSVLIDAGHDAHFKMAWVFARRNPLLPITTVRERKSRNSIIDTNCKECQFRNCSQKNKAPGQKHSQHVLRSAFAIL